MPASPDSPPLAFDAIELPRIAAAPRLSRASCALLRQIDILDEYGERRVIEIPIERPLTVFADRRELVTLMTLGAAPELLVLGYLLNQGLIEHCRDVDGIDVDWDVDAAAVRTHAGLAAPRMEASPLPDAPAARIARSELQRLLAHIRERDSVHKRAGSVHGCALFDGGEVLVFAEDVGRHNAIDTVAGWMALHGIGGGDKVFYTTGRLTSEMVMKAAKMGLPIVVSRNGVTAMGQALAARLGMTLIGRAISKRFVCYGGFERFVDDEPQAELGIEPDSAGLARR